MLFWRNTTFGWGWLRNAVPKTPQSRFTFYPLLRGQPMNCGSSSWYKPGLIDTGSRGPYSRDPCRASSFTLEASTPLLFCEILPGGKHVVLVHRNGDLSLQSLVDLGNIHEISKLSLGPLSFHMHTVSLVTDREGRPLLALCIHGSPRRHVHVHDFLYLADQFQAFLCHSRDRNKVYQPCQALRGRFASDSYCDTTRHRRVFVSVYGTGRFLLCRNNLGLYCQHGPLYFANTRRSSGKLESQTFSEEQNAYTGHIDNLSLQHLPTHSNNPPPLRSVQYPVLPSPRPIGIITRRPPSGRTLTNLVLRKPYPSEGSLNSQLPALGTGSHNTHRNHAPL